MTRIAFVCVGNAGRSQLATALAERQRERRGLDDLEIVTGGVDPADRLHDDVVEVLREEGIDIGDREPRQITAEDVEDAAYVVTMGCSVDDFVSDDWDGTAERWELDHPGGDDLDATRAQRDEVEDRVVEFFDRADFGGD